MDRLKRGLAAVDVPAVFHMYHDGETATSMDTLASGTRAIPRSVHAAPQLPSRDAGFVVGLLLGEGHFGGDGRQAQVTLRMHTRHEQTFRWLEEHLPGGRLYGPYLHGGRSYYQWMSRGRHLTEVLVPLILENADLVNNYVWERFLGMCERYGLTPHAAP